MRAQNPKPKKKRRTGIISDMNRTWNPFTDSSATDNQWYGSGAGLVGGAMIGGLPGALVGSGVGYLAGGVVDGISKNRTYTIDKAMYDGKKQIR